MNSVGLDRPKVRDDLAVIEIDGEAVVVDPVAGGLHHLNRAAAAVFFSCDGTTTATELSEGLAEVFGADPQEVARDVEPLLAELGAAGLLVTTGEGCRDCGAP